MTDVFNVALLVLILVCTLVFIYFVGIHIVGGYIYPMFNSLIPSRYQSTSSHLFQGLRWFFYILLAIPFLYIIIRLLYKKEEVSVYYGGYV